MNWTLVALACSAMAGLVNLAIAFSSAHNNKRTIRLAVGFSAFYYCAAFGYLLYGGVSDRAAWSEALAPASAFAFLTVWMADAITDYYRTRKVERWMQS